MKRIILPAALIFVLSGPLALSGPRAYAQDSQAPAADTQSPPPAAQKHHEHDAHREAMQMSKKLNLTPDQTAKIEPLLADRDQKTQALAANTSLSDQDRKKQERAIRRDSTEQIDAILTPDQQAQMKAGHHGKKGDDEAQPPSTPPSA